MSLLNKIAKRNEPLFIDKPIFTVNKISFNALGYCAYLGSDKIFKELFDGGASLKIMEELYLSQGLRVINVICSKGHLDLLKFYLPLYIRHYRSSIASFKSLTLDLYDEKSPQDIPIHAACRSGMFHIVSFLHNQFKNHPEVPNEFNILALDEMNGEDAGLIACRVGCFPLVKLLHEQCDVKFARLNKFREGAILICVKADALETNFSYLEILTYLVEVVGLDLAVGFERVLKETKNLVVLKYVREKLAELGVEGFEGFEGIERIEGIEGQKARGSGRENDVTGTRVVRESLDSDGLNAAFGDLNSFASSISSVYGMKETPMSIANIL